MTNFIEREYCSFVLNKKHLSIRFYAINDDFMDDSPFVTRSTFPNKECSFSCFVSNEKNHNYFLLEDIPAKILLMICSNCSFSFFYNFIKENKIENEIYSFLNLLKENEIILYKEEVKNKKANSNFFKEEKNTKEENYQSLEFAKNMTKFFLKNNFLETLFWELTYDCNLNCIHCFQEKTNLKGFKNLGYLKSIIDDAQKLGIFRVVLSGGESTLHPYFLEIAKYIREKSLSLIIYTNGQKLADDETLLKEIEELYPYKVYLSLYSLTPEIHDSITRVKGSFNKTINTIKYLRKKNINVGINCFVGQNNFDSCLDIIDFCNEIGATYSFDVNFVNNTNKNNSFFKLNDEQLFSIYTNKKSPIRILNTSYPSNLTLEELKQQPVCLGGHSGLTISPDLNVYVCPSLKSSFGNLEKHSLVDIWKGNKETSALTVFKNKKLGTIEGCFEEEYCLFCSYCPGKSMYDSNYLKKNPTFCSVAKIRYNAYKNNLGN